VNKEERIKRFKSMSSMQRQELILKKMKERGIEVGSGIPNEKYDNREVYELIHISKCFPELREKKIKVLDMIFNKHLFAYFFLKFF